MTLGALTISLCFGATRVLAAGGTSIIADKGSPVDIPKSWPEGVGALVNDPTRTTGWNSWFTEWPNDVNHYAFEVQATDDINRLIKKLVAVQSEIRQVRLSHLEEPASLGWVTRAPRGNNIAVVFSIGDQLIIDEWYKHVRQPFGQMKFTGAPVAVPPTLTIFVRNQAVNLDELKVPEGIELSSGYVPTVFHRSNTIEERQARIASIRDKKAVSNPAAKTMKLDPSSQKAEDEITAFVKKHQAKDSK
jgi:hypothetical protein